MPPLLAAAALGAAFLLSRRAAPSRESVLPLSRAVADQEKALDRAAARAFPLTPDQERRIGARIDARLSREAAPRPGSPAAARAARWSRLGRLAESSPLVTRFRGRYVFRTTLRGGVNAFAVPGGYVYATDALLRRFPKDDDALLFVLGHELGHVELGHCADAYRLTAASDPAREVLGGALSLGRLFVELHFSPTQELEADAFSVRLLRSLGRDPRAGLRVFDGLGLRAGGNVKRGPGEVAAEGLADYFRTHPGAWERRAALERDIEETR
ncbi:MAG: M48 family metalloprotease [Elusimicrobia bacterium]|nr:M48 family metalloprotease [Elusimicrobiota bacterium]